MVGLAILFVSATIVFIVGFWIYDGLRWWWKVRQFWRHERRVNEIMHERQKRVQA